MSKDPCDKGVGGWIKDTETGECIRPVTVKVELYQGGKCQGALREIKLGNPALRADVARLIERYLRSRR